jgi:hypothetical protein
VNQASASVAVTLAAEEIGSAAIGQLTWPENTVGITAPPMTRTLMPLLLAILTRSGADLTGTKPTREQALAMTVARLSTFDIQRVVVGQAHTLPDQVTEDLLGVCDTAGTALLLVADPFGGAEWLSARRTDSDRSTWTDAALHPLTETNAASREGEPPPFPVDVPTVDFHFFVDAVTHSLDKEARRLVLEAFDRGARRGLGAAVASDADARVLLADVWKEASTMDEALALTRGVQAGLFHRGTLLKMDINALGEFISGGYARAVDSRHYGRLRCFSEPWKALAASMFLAGQTPAAIAEMTPADVERVALDPAAECYRNNYLRYLSLRPGDKSAQLPSDVRKIRGILRALPHLGIPADVSASTLRARTHGTPASPGWHPRLSIRVRTL